MSPLRAERLHQQLAGELASQIVSKRLSAGEPIPSEPELVEAYGVSKTVARETVQALATAGLVRVQHGKRTVVLDEGDWDILSPVLQAAFRAEGLAGDLVEELYEVRLLLEPQAARLTAERSSRVQVEELESILERMTDSAAAGALERFLDHDSEFHFTIGTAASNRVLRAVMRDIHELLMSTWVLSELTVDDMAEVVAQHRAIADAISASDPKAAEAAMMAHLTWATQTDVFGATGAARARTGG